MQNLSTVMVDANGASTIVLLHLTDAAILTDGVAALSTGSNGDWLSYWGSTVVTQAPAPATGDYQSVRDKAHLVYTDGTDLVAVDLPAPVAALFLADQETVDPADPTGVLAALAAILTTASGSPVTAFVAGYCS